MSDLESLSGLPYAGFFIGIFQEGCLQAKESVKAKENHTKGFHIYEIEASWAK